MLSSGADEVFGIDPVVMLSFLVVLQPLAATATQMRAAARTENLGKDESEKVVFAAVIMLSSIVCLAVRHRQKQVAHFPFSNKLLTLTKR
jgi:hypothetical protein